MSGFEPIVLPQKADALPTYPPIPHPRNLATHPLKLSHLSPCLMFDKLKVPEGFARCMSRCTSPFPVSSNTLSACNRKMDSFVYDIISHYPTISAG